MKLGAQTVAGLAAGYLLGRTRKMRLALAVAALGATGNLGGSSRELLQQGLKQLSESPELGKVADSVKGELLDAVRAAAMTAATSRIESLSGRLQERPNVPGAVSDLAEAVEPEEESAEEQAPEDEDGQRSTEQRRPRTRAAQAPAQRRASERGQQRTAARSSSGRSPVQRTRR